MERVRKEKEEREAAEGNLSNGENEEDDDVIDGTGPFQSLNDHLRSKVSQSSGWLSCWIVDLSQFVGQVDSRLVHLGIIAFSKLFIAPMFAQIKS